MFEKRDYSSPMKLMKFFKSSGKTDRIRTLTEIRLNQLVWRGKPRRAMDFKDACNEFPVEVRDIISSGEAELTVSKIRGLFAELEQEQGSRLPFPVTFNADITFAILVYAFARTLRPKVVLECGVGYGISSALILLALDQTGIGSLQSLDLPALADPEGVYTGAVVPKILRNRWQLRYGSSRKLLPGVLREIDEVGLFISDSANVFTLQKYEYEIVFPKLAHHGVMIFNNISARFQAFLESTSKGNFSIIWQVEKVSCATALIVKE